MPVCKIASAATAAAAAAAAAAKLPLSHGSWRAAEDIVQSSTRPLWVGVVMMCGEGFKVIAARGRGCKEGLPCVEAVLVS